MILSREKANDTLKLSVQINNGFADMSADGVNMAFDKNHGIMFGVYMAYSTSELALEYQNGNPSVRGKDTVRYVKLGDLIRGTMNELYKRTFV